MASAPPATATPTPTAAAPSSDDPFAAPDQGVHIEDVFGWDSAEAEAAPVETPLVAAPASVGAGEGEAGGAAVEGAPSAEPAPVAEPAPPPTPDEKELELTSLKEQVRLLTEAANKPAEPAPVETPAAVATPAKLDPIKIELPKELSAAIFGEDPDAATGAMNTIVSSISTSIRDMGVAVLAEVDRRMEALKAAQPAADASGTPAADTVAAKAAAEDQYYAKFPAHKKPEILPIIASCAAELAAALPNHPWDDNYIAALGTRVADKLKKIAGTANGSPAAPPPVLPAGTRSAAPAAGDGDISDEIEDVLGF